MKRGTKLLLLLAVLAVAGLGDWLASRYTAQLEAEEESPGVSVLSIDAEAVTALGWTYDGEEVSLVYDGGEWTYAASDVCPIDQSYPQAMVDALAALLAQETIEDPEELAGYGLEEPQCTVTLTADGADYELLIGDETALGGQRDLSTGDGAVYLTDDSLLSSFSYGLYDIIQMEEIPAMDDVSALTVHGEVRDLELRYQENSSLAYSDDYVWFLAEDGDWLALDTALTESLMETVTGLSWQSCVSYDASEEDLAAYGLDDPAVTAEVTYTVAEEDGESQSRTETFTLEIGNYSGESCYARIAGSSMVYLIDAAVSDSLLYTAYDDLRPDEVLSMDWDTVTAIDVTVDGRSYTVTRQVTDVTDEDGEESQEAVYLLDGAEVEFQELLDALNAMASTGSAVGLIPERSALVAFTFHRNTDAFSQVELVFYQYDSANCLVSLDGEVVLLAAREDVEAVAESAAALTPGT